MTASSKPEKCVVVPARPPIDKLIAFKRVRLDLEGRFRLRIAFCDVNIPTPGHHARWSAMCTPETGDPYLIDVGDKKYHDVTHSAAETEKMSSETDGGRTWNRLVELANDNNKTGKLKQARHSVAKIIRDAYEVMNGGLGSQEVVFEHGMDVVDGFFFRQNSRSWDELFTNGDYVGLRSLWDGFNVSEGEVLPFTLPLYFRHLFLGGRSAAEITEKISWWLEKVKRIDARRVTAKNKQYTAVQFDIGNKHAGLIRVKDAFEAEAATYQWIGSGRLAIGVIRNGLGHVHVQSSFRHPGSDLAELAKALESLEPGRWYYETRFPAGQMLMNGSRQFTGVTPTSLTDEALKRLVYASVTFSK